MAFYDNYYQEIIDKWIDDFSKEPTNEYLLRNILSRAYYTMFLHCRKIHEIDLKSQGFKTVDESHMNVINMITNQGIQTLVYKYKKFRERSDYNVEPLKLPVYVKINRTPESLQNIKMVPAHITTVFTYK